MIFLQLALTAAVVFFIAGHQIQQGIAAAVAARFRGDKPKFPRTAVLVHILALWVGVISGLAAVWSLPNWF